MSGTENKIDLSAPPCPCVMKKECIYKQNYNYWVLGAKGKTLCSSDVMRKQQKSRIKDKDLDSGTQGGLNEHQVTLVRVITWGKGEQGRNSDNHRPGSNKWNWTMTIFKKAKKYANVLSCCQLWEEIGRNTCTEFKRYVPWRVGGRLN